MEKYNINISFCLNMYILILVLPLLSGLLGLFGRWLGRFGVSLLNTFLLFVTWFLSIWIFVEVCLYSTVVNIYLYTWLTIDIYQLNIGLLFDSLSSSMVVVVLTISMLVHLYSTAYMSHDPYLIRFMSYLSWFTFCMLILVTSDNFFQLFIGWEGVGLCSYLLINFWFTRLAANRASLKAMMVNRISDLFFLLAIVILFEFCKTTDFMIIFSLLPELEKTLCSFFGFNIYKINLIAFLLFIGAVGKSAQMGFHTWLPDAMEGPTPVSALLHAATMVTAGVFLIIRCSHIIESSMIVLISLVLIGGITSVYAGIVAIFQYDVKKVIAYSTCSQLGYMFFSCGLSNYSLAFFHLWNHAFFKALLFLSAGSLIHAFFDEQDIRRHGCLIHLLPFTYMCFVVGSLAIMGFPFLTGFYSKDIILEFAYSRYIINGLFIYNLGLLSAICTSIYSIRLIYLIFFARRYFAGYFTSYYNNNLVNEGLWQMTLPMLFLLVCSIFVGYLTSDLCLLKVVYFEMMQLCCHRIVYC